MEVREFGVICQVLSGFCCELLVGVFDVLM